jgi:hypothetical protein
LIALDGKSAFLSADDVGGVSGGIPGASGPPPAVKAENSGFG